MPNKVASNPAVEIVNAVALAYQSPEAPQGGTVPLTALRVPTVGFLVGGAYPAVVADSPATLSATAVRDLVTNAHTLFAGWWVDSDDGKVYVDAVQWYQSEHTATAVAHARGEIAIWDLKNGREVRV